MNCKTQNIYTLFNEYGIQWFDNDSKALNYEYLSKYAVFPNAIIGYYYFQNGNCQYYYINPYIA